VVHLGRHELRVTHILIGLAATAAVLVTGVLLLVLSGGRAHALDLPVGNDTASPLAPVVDVVAPILPDPPTASTVDPATAATPVAPVVQAVTAPLAPVAQTATTPLAPVAPVVQAATAPLTPLVAGVTAPLAPVVQTVTAPLAPVAEAVTGPLAGISAPLLGTVGSSLSPVVPRPSAAAPLLTLVGQDRDAPRGPRPPTDGTPADEPPGPMGTHADRRSTAGTHRAAPSIDAGSRTRWPIPTPAPAPPSPASAAPGTASGGSSAPSFQLVVYLIAAMLAALLLPRGGRALRLGVVAPRAAFVSLIERPG
jgi:hypothetical protein